MTDHNDYLARRAAIVGKQQRSVLERLGLTDPGLTADERAARHDLRQLNAEEAKQLASTRDYGPRARSALVEGARNLAKTGGALYRKPDPLGPTSVQTDGPMIDYGVPTATARVCSLQLHSILDTSANRGTNFHPDGTEDSSFIEQSTEIDWTPGLNEARFSFRAGGDELDDSLTVQYSVGFRFNFHPPADGGYAFAPVASLSGAWMAGSLAALGGRGALRLALRSRATQFGDDEILGHAINDIVLVDSDKSFGVESGTFDLSTPSGGTGPLVQGDFVADQRVNVTISAHLDVHFEGLGFVDVDALGEGLGLTVPEVHAFTVACFQMSLDGPGSDVGEPLPGGPAVPGEPGVPRPPGGDPFSRRVRR